MKPSVRLLCRYFNDFRFTVKIVTLDMVPSPSTWNPRPSTLDKKIDSTQTLRQPRNGVTDWAIALLLTDN